MRAAVFEGDKKISIKEVAKPVLQDNEALIKVIYGAISPSEIDHPRIQPMTVMGHEFSGEIEEIYTQQQNINIKVGDRVAVKTNYPCGYCEACQRGLFHICQNMTIVGIDTDGGFAEYIKAPINNIIKIGDNVGYEEITLIEPLAVALHAVRRSSFRVGDSVIILGGGVIGLLISLVLKLAGASRIIVIEINNYRLNKIKELGFEAIDAGKTGILDRVQELTNGAGVDILFESAGVQDMAKQLVNLIKICGEIIVVGTFTETVSIDLQNLAAKEQKIVGVRLYTSEDIKKAVKQLENRQIEVAPLFTHRFSFNDIDKAINLVRNKGDALKVLISISG
jgi:(R,R)-butanediol dehydrogenase / meso-butanediol dehydrogenase / diacetyl reductase